jgi:hypothetical protein
MTNRRGFSKERHPLLKVGLTLLAVAGFGAGWFAFAGAHDFESAIPADGTDLLAAAEPTPAHQAAVTARGDDDEDDDGEYEDGDEVTPEATPTPTRAPRSALPPTSVPPATIAPRAPTATNEQPQPTPTRARRSRAS